MKKSAWVMLYKELLSSSKAEKHYKRASPFNRTKVYLLVQSHLLIFFLTAELGEQNFYKQNFYV